MELWFLISGIILLVLVMFDFFFTSLSGSGAGFITNYVFYLAHKLIQFLVKAFGRKVFDYSGMIVNILVLAGWLLVVWAGLYLIFSSDPTAVVNTSTGLTASHWDRLYFTGYTLSTLGMGDISTTTAAFKILTSCFSFFGFIFFTSSMTYLISVSSAVIHKRELARSIHNLGRSPRQIANELLELERPYSLQQLRRLQEMVDRHAVNHQAYPVLHYYAHSEASVSVSLNLVRLDEALSILLTSRVDRELKKVIHPLRYALTHFLNHLEANYSKTLIKSKHPVTSLPYEVEFKDQGELGGRREILGGLLRSEHYDWEDVSHT